MAEGKHIPEEIVVGILSRLPVKSLIRFVCVSIRWRSILSDLQFAKLQSENKNQGHRRLVYFLNDFDIESLDLEMPSPWSSILKLPSPFEHRDRKRCRVRVVGSCNGLVCVSVRDSFTCLYIWNPSTGFSLNLPQPDFPDEIKSMSNYCGFGYLPATDDYKVLVAAYNSRDAQPPLQVRIFSTRGGIWKRIESPFKSSYPPYITRAPPALLGVALHWVMRFPQRSVIHAFDLAKEECREMLGFDRLRGIDFCGGCLYGFRMMFDACRCIELWVMREYGVSESWTKLYKFKLSNELEPPMLLYPFLATKTSIVVAKAIPEDYTMEIIRLEHEGEEPLITDRLRRRYHMPAMIVVEESLLRIPDYHAAVIEYKINKITVGPAKLKSREIIATCCLALFNYFWLIILIFTLPYYFYSVWPLFTSFQQKQ